MKEGPQTGSVLLALVKLVPALPGASLVYAVLELSAAPSIIASLLLLLWPKPSIGAARLASCSPGGTLTGGTSGSAESTLR